MTNEPELCHLDWVQSSSMSCSATTKSLLGTRGVKRTGCDQFFATTEDCCSSDSEKSNFSPEQIETNLLERKKENKREARKVAGSVQHDLLRAVHAPRLPGMHGRCSAGPAQGERESVYVCLWEGERERERSERVRFQTPARIFPSPPSPPFWNKTDFFRPGKKFRRALPSSFSLFSLRTPWYEQKFYSLSAGFYFVATKDVE